MSSLKGRKVQPWVNTAQGCLDKAIAHMLYRTFYEHGYRGKTLGDAVFAKFEHLRPDHGRTKSSVTSRGMTTTISHHRHVRTSSSIDTRGHTAASQDR